MGQPRGFYKYCGTSCFLMSIWGMIQLSLMAIFYHMEAVTLIEDVEPTDHEFADATEYVEKCHKGYKNTAINCMGSAIGYLVTLILSLLCLRKSKKLEDLHRLKLLDDELSCVYPPIRSILDLEEVMARKKKKKCIIM